MICITYAEVQPLMFESILSKQMKFMEFEKLLNDAGMVALVPCVNGSKR
jgi:hypothetical protein